MNCCSAARKRLNLRLTRVFVGPEQQGRRVGVDQQLHVVQGKLLNVVPQLVLLIHALEETQSGGPHLERGKQAGASGLGQPW